MRVYRAIRRWWVTSPSVARQFVREWRDDRVSGLAAEIAFFGLLSLFPTLVAVAAGLGFLETIAGQEVARRVETELLDFLSQVLTERASGLLDAAERLFEGASPGFFTVGAVLSLWAASRGFVAVIRALDVAYDIEERRNYIALRALALALALGSVIVVSLVLAMVVVGPLLGTGRDVADDLGFGDLFVAFWTWLRWPVAVVVMLGWATTVFHFAPNHRTPWRWDLPGAILTAGWWALVSVGLRSYLRLAAGSNEVLGSLGGSLVAVVWLYLLGVCLLAGAELNAILAQRAGLTDPERSARPPRQAQGATSRDRTD